MVEREREREEKKKHEKMKNGTTVYECKINKSKRVKRKIRISTSGAVDVTSAMISFTVILANSCSSATNAKSKVRTDTCTDSSTWSGEATGEVEIITGDPGGLRVGVTGALG